MRFYRRVFMKNIRTDIDTVHLLEAKASELKTSFSGFLIHAAMEYPIERVMEKRTLVIALNELNAIIDSVHMKSTSEEEKEHLESMRGRLGELWNHIF